MSPEAASPADTGARNGRQNTPVTMDSSVAPPGLRSFRCRLPRADARGYCLTRLRRSPFALPTSSWRTPVLRVIAQWEENLLDQEQKIARPRQIYLGAGPREYVPMSERG